MIQLAGVLPWKYTVFFCNNGFFSPSVASSVYIVGSWILIRLSSFPKESPGRHIFTLFICDMNIPCPYNID